MIVGHPTWPVSRSTSPATASSASGRGHWLLARRPIRPGRDLLLRLLRGGCRVTHGAGWAVCPWGIDLRFGAGGTATVREGVQMADADGHYAFTHGGADEGRRL